MLRPVERSITVSAPHVMLQRIFSTSSSMELEIALLPMFDLIFTRKFRPMIIGSDSGWLMFDGMLERPRAVSSQTNSVVLYSVMLAPQDSPACCNQLFERPLTV